MMMVCFFLWRNSSLYAKHQGTSSRRTRQSSAIAQSSKRFHNLIGMLLSQISQHRNGNIFHNPIRPAEAPDYHDIVKRPMDLKTIKGRIRDNVITDTLQFERDIYLMFMNAMIYNRPHSDIFKMAQEVSLPLRRLLLLI
jgi:bromodomain-containing protein 8